MNISNWILDPFLSANTKNFPHLQEKLMKLTTNDEFKFKIGYEQFWLQEESTRAYSQIWAVIQKLLIEFPSSYLVNSGLNSVTNLLTKKKTITNSRSR